ncbi:MAG: zinc-dependent metalloprotease [Nocardioidaceae bacterium]
MVDWDLAVSVGARLAGQGPVVSRGEADEVVAELREGAASSTQPVREFTGLASTAATAEVLVVDRRGWLKANADGFAHVLAPVIAKIEERKGAPSGFTQAVGSRMTGAEVGAVLGFLAGKVLGQFDPFYAPAGSTASGRLLLVAPNIVHAERELGVDPHDFRLWVCLHEETHRVQFTAVPWMREHIEGMIGTLVEGIETDPTKLASFLGDGVKRMGDVIRGTDGASLIDLLSTPEQRVLLDQVTAVMSLLEGHADVVMDGVGPEVIPTVAEIRKRFNQRRKGSGNLDRLLRRLLGLDAKMAQYRDGEKFVQGVIDRVGMEGFNKVWVEPANLPTRAEVGDPEAWVRRIHGA